MSVCREVPLSLVDTDIKIATKQATPIRMVVTVALDVDVLKDIKLPCVILTHWPIAIPSDSRTSEKPI